MAHILSQSAFWMVNKQASKKLGSPLKALLLSDIISRYEYFQERNMLDDEGYFFCSYEDIANDLCVSDSTIRKYLKDLIEKGLIKSKKVAGVPPRWFYCIVNDEIDKILSNDTKNQVQNESVNLPIYNGESTDMNRQMYRHNNNNKEIIINNNKEYIPKDENGSLFLNGNAPTDEETQKARQERKMFLDENVDKEAINKDVKIKLWEYCVKRKFVNITSEMTKLCNQRKEFIESWYHTFLAYYNDKMYESYFDFDKKISSHVEMNYKQDCGKARWCKVYEDKLKVDSNSDLPDYYDENLYNSLAGEQLTAYKKTLYKAGYRYDRVKQCWKDRNGRVANGRRLKTKVADNTTPDKQELSDTAKESIDKLGTLFEEMGNKMNVNKK